MTLDLRSSELEHTFIKDRICNVEKHFSEISSKLSAYNKKSALLRDSGDDLAKCILNFASKENLNVSLRSSLMQFADLLVSIQEYRDAQVQRTEVKVVLEFDNYNHICKKAKGDLKRCYEIRVKELSKKNQLEKIRGKNPNNWQKVVQAEKSLIQAQDESTRTKVELSKRLDDFERQKIEDIKHGLLEFIQIEMLFHAKSIELYTNAYNVIKNIRVEDDLKEFRSHFRSYSSPPEPENAEPEMTGSIKATTNIELNSCMQRKTTSDSSASAASLKSLEQSIISIPSTSTPEPSFKSSFFRKNQRTQNSDSQNKPPSLGNSSVDSLVQSKNQ